LVACQRAVKQLCGTHSPERNRPEHLHGSTNVVASSCETAHIYVHFPRRVKSQRDWDGAAGEISVTDSSQPSISVSNPQDRGTSRRNIR